MAHDIISDALNQIMNARKVEKKSVEIKHFSKLLINLFEIMKKKGHIDFKVNENSITVEIIDVK